MEKTKVLVPESDKLYLDMITDVLKEADFDMQVFTAEDGMQALDIISQNKIDMIFTEIYLPYADGYHIIESNTNEQCINVISSFETYGIIQSKYIDKKVDYIFIKPYKKEIVAKRIKTIFENKTKKLAGCRKQRINYEVSKLLTALGIPVNMRG